MTIQHGYSRYNNHGCRCTICTEGNRLQQAEYRARRRQRREAAASAASPEDVLARIEEKAEYFAEQARRYRVTADVLRNPPPDVPGGVS